MPVGRMNAVAGDFCPGAEGAVVQAAVVVQVEAAVERVQRGRGACSCVGSRGQPSLG